MEHVPDSAVERAICRWLDIAAFEQAGDRKLRAALPVPGWWTSLVGSASILDQEDLAALPFLADFLVDAEAIWCRDTDALAPSGPFETQASDDQVLLLDAVALRESGKKWLIVRNLTTLGGVLPNVLQTARENMLRHREDVARHQEHVTELVQERDEAERLDRMKSEFLANMSHEFRTPLTTILGMTTLALEAGHGQDLREYLDCILSSAKQLLRLSNDVLDLSKIRAAKLDLEAVEFSIRTTMEQLCDEFRPRAQQKGLDLQCEVDPEVPDRVIGDPLRLRQVIANLLNNAVKFTQRGGIRIRVRPDTVAIPGRVMFSIADTGMGIPADQQRAIFDSFTQVDASASRRHQGAGLGLAIASSLVKMMQGSIRVSSVPGEGSEFCFDAQFGVLAAVNKAPSEIASAERNGPGNDGVQPLRILVAEDHQHNRLLIVRTLEARGHTVVEAKHGGEAVEAWRREPFDVVVMDCQMPEVTGEEATATIRRHEKETGGHVPIVALTAHAMSDERSHFLQIGMDEYVAKPFRKETLINAVEQVARMYREKDDRGSGSRSGE